MNIKTISDFLNRHSGLIGVAAAILILLVISSGSIQNQVVNVNIAPPIVESSTPLPWHAGKFFVESTPTEVPEPVKVLGSAKKGKVVTPEVQVDWTQEQAYQPADTYGQY